MKPDDVPQWAWDAAVFALYGKAPDDWIEQQVVIISRCARALVAAREDGANEVLRIKYLPHMVEQLSSELAHEWGPKVAEAAKELTRTHKDYKPWKIDLNVKMDDVLQQTVIRGVIPELRYHMTVTRLSRG